MGVSVPEDDEYDTLGGFVLTHLGRMPEVNETFTHGRNTAGLYRAGSHQERVPGIAHLFCFPRRATQRLGGDNRHKRRQAVNDDMLHSTDTLSEEMKRNAGATP